MENLTPYLFFDGNCREAMNFYQKCLGGELQLMTYGEAQTKGAECTSEMKDKAIHSTLKRNDLTLMGSDIAQGSPQRGNNVHLSLICNSGQEIEKTFQELSKGGKVLHPLHDEFWGARFGTLIDKYGFEWMLSCDKAKL